MDRLSGKGGEKEFGSGGVVQVGSWGGEGESKEGPRRRVRDSRRMLCRRWSWEDIKGAEWRSPVQRVISTQSRDWLRRVRRFDNAGRTRGVSGERERWVAGRVLRRRWSVCLNIMLVLNYREIEAKSIRLSRFLSLRA